MKRHNITQRKFNRNYSIREAQGEFWSRILTDSPTISEDVAKAISDAPPANTTKVPGSPPQNMWDFFANKFTGGDADVLSKGIGRNQPRLTDPADLDGYMRRLTVSPDAPKDFNGNIGKIWNFFQQRPAFNAVTGDIADGIVLRTTKFAIDPKTGSPAIDPTTGDPIIISVTNQPITIGQICQPQKLTGGLKTGTNMAQEVVIDDLNAFQASFDRAMNKFAAVSKYDINIMKGVRLM